MSENFDAPAVGPDLDAAIAERIFGLIPCQAPWHDHHVGCCYAPPDRPFEGYHLHAYSRSLSAAWRVVEAMMANGYRYVLRGNFEGNGLHWAGFDPQAWADLNPLYQSPLCATMAEAVCRAALAAVAREETHGTALDHKP